MNSIYSKLYYDEKQNPNEIKDKFVDLVLNINIIDDLLMTVN